MKYVFSPEGLAQLEALRNGSTLFAFDFDGTLAPIVADAKAARLPLPTRRLLEQLSRVAPVAAISGRPLGELRKLLPNNFRGWAGDHGAEIYPRKFQGKPDLKNARKLVRKWAKALAPILRDLPGVWIENKELSLSVHFRSSPRRTTARNAILRAVAQLESGPRVLPGKCVVNLINPRLPHKGDAVQCLLRGLKLRQAIYVGDDSNDEDVFALDDRRIHTVRVGRLAGSRASLYLRRQADINRLLRHFLSSLPGKTGTRYRGARAKKESSPKGPAKAATSAPATGKTKTVDRHRPRRHKDRRRDGARGRPRRRRSA